MNSLNNNQQITKSRMRAILTRFGTRSTQFVGKYWGEHFPFYYVTEFPRSGGTWLSKMIADYLQIPKPTRTIFPMGCSCVIQNHWNYTPGLKRVFYLHRDGRDVCISAFFFVLRGFESKTPHIVRYFESRYPGSSTNWNQDNAREVLPRFIELWCTKPFGTRVPWHKHVSNWVSDHPDVVTTSYEQLRENCYDELARIIPLHTGMEIDEPRLMATIDKFSFANQTGRKPGEMVATSHQRKGIVGDWKNYFSQEATDAFQRHAGPALRKLGYADESSPEPTVPTTGN